MSTLGRRFRPEWARVVSGEDEGVYGWIALNYQTAHLSVNPRLATSRARLAGGSEAAQSSELRMALSDSSCLPCTACGRAWIIMVKTAVKDFHTEYDALC